MVPEFTFLVVGGFTTVADRNAGRTSALLRSVFVLILTSEALDEPGRRL